MAKQIVKRIERLEQARPEPGERITDIFVTCPSAGFGAPEYTDEDVTGCRSGSVYLRRQPGETLDELTSRAVATSSDGAVRIWHVEYTEAA